MRWPCAWRGSAGATRPGGGSGPSGPWSSLPACPPSLQDNERPDLRPPILAGHMTSPELVHHSAIKVLVESRRLEQGLFSQLPPSRPEPVAQGSAEALLGPTQNGRRQQIRGNVAQDQLLVRSLDLQVVRQGPYVFHEGPVQKGAPRLNRVSHGHEVRLREKVVREIGLHIDG